MPTPSIQTLTTDAQQVLNLDSISAVRSVVAVALANANTGTPLNPNLTTQQLWDQFYQVVTRPKSDIESIIANQLMKFLYAPPAPGGAGADKQVIFNDGGVLAGDADFLWNKTTNLLTVTGSATISGDLTVDTSTLKVDSANNRLGIGTATPVNTLEVVAPAGDNIVSTFRSGDATAANNAGGGFRSISSATAANRVAQVWLDADGANFSGGDYFFIQKNGGSGTVEFNQSSNAAMVFLTNSTERYRIASDGVATWSNVGGVAGTAMTLNSTGLGVGTSPSHKLHVLNTSLSGTTAGSNVIATLRSNGSGYDSFLQFSDNVAYNAGLGMLAGNLYFYTNGAERARIDTSGNVGIGVTPSAWAAGYTALQNRQTSWFSTSARDLNLGANVYVDAVGYKYIATAAASNYVQYLGAHSWYTAASGTAGTSITDFATAKMTLDASGNLLVGVTSTTTPGVGNTTAGASLNANGAAFFSHASSQALYLNTNADSQIVSIRRSNVSVGSISVTTTATAYNTSSDYRLKESVQPLVGGLARISALKPSIYKWKADGSNGEGFLAHELAEVVPIAVTGEKDAVNEDGSIKAQGVDLSKVVPILVAAIQELTARVQTLETR